MPFLLQRLGPGENGPVRVHLDLGTDDRAAEVERVRSAGAKLADDTPSWRYYENRRDSRSGDT
jgi:hypothetical protein